VYQQQIAACDAPGEAQRKGLPSKAAEDAPWPPPQRNRKPRKSAPPFDLRGPLYRLSGVDRTGIDGSNVLTAQTLVSEIGLDLSAGPTEKHFASWLGLCPDHRMSGGKILKRGTRQVLNRAATAFRWAASPRRNSKSAWGANFRRLRSRLGAPQAIPARAHKLARWV
jgi:transposase